jgi:YspA, cpYpsA-related SLOG family
MRTIIAGSRTIHDPETVYDAVQESGFNITTVISGGAMGIDEMGAEWAVAQCIDVKFFIPDWELHGKSAGIIRNKQMALYADALIAIWDGESGGTKHMIAHAKKLGLKVYVKIV